MKIKYPLITAALFIIFSAADISAQQFVYTPINPSFGGNTYNGTWMLASAQAQNNLKEESAVSSSYTRDPLQDFKESLNRQILSQISRELVTSTFGESGLEDGHYEFGDYIIDISQGIEGVNINILDITNGSETNILVPYL